MGMTYFSLSAGEITIAYNGPTNPASPGSVDPTLLGRGRGGRHGKENQVPLRQGR